MDLNMKDNDFVYLIPTTKEWRKKLLANNFIQDMLKPSLPINTVMDKEGRFAFVALSKASATSPNKITTFNQSKLTINFSAGSIFFENNQSEINIDINNAPFHSIYYLELREIVIISTNIKTILLLPYVKLSVNLLSAAHFLHLGAPLPGKTLTHEISKIPHNNKLHIQLQPFRLSIREKKNFYMPLADLSQKNAVDELEDRLTKSIHIKTQEESCGILLSGGIDSAIILALAQEKNNFLKEAYTLSVDDVYDMSEDEEAAETASYYGIKHYSVPLTSQEAIEYLETILEEPHPHASWASIGHKKILNFSFQQGITQLFSGLGADELFFGYTSMAKHFFSVTEEAIKNYSGNWLKVLERDYETKAFNFEPYKGIARFCEREESFDPVFYEQINKIHLDQAKKFVGDASSVDIDLSTYIISHEFNNRIPNTLMPSFQNYNSYGTKMYYPFIQTSVYEFAHSLSWQERISFDDEKWWHKHLIYNLAKKILPVEIWQRKKGYYNIPYADWLAEKEFGHYVLYRCNNIETYLSPFFPESFIDKFTQTLKRVVNGEEETSRWIGHYSWIFMVYYAWAQKYCKSHYTARDLTTCF